jgi:chromate reductase
MISTIRFVGISGSLRKGSYNTMLLINAMQVLPENVAMEIISIADIPMYNGDLDLPITQTRPDEVNIFREKLASADAILFVSPEYNYSVPGVLKNAIDWASRGEDSPLLHKPVAVMGATPGMWGTSRMQLSFHAIFQFLDMRAALKPEVMVASAKTKFDEAGKLTDAKALELMGKKLAALKELVIQLHPNKKDEL